MMLWGKKVKNAKDAALPRHVGIIMDGNGRWAKKRGLPRSVGHRHGAQALKKIALFCDGLGIEALTVYAFSTENWKRPKAEVDHLLALLREYLSNAKEELGGKNIVIKVIGNLAPFSDDLKQKIKATRDDTRENTGMVLNIALNYGARDELVSAVKSIIRHGGGAEDITEEAIERHLFTAGCPPVDLIIRPSGELRLSNFLLWQGAYSELWFSDVLWPDFSEKHLLRAFDDYKARNRRYGGI